MMIVHKSGLHLPSLEMHRSVQNPVQKGHQIVMELENILFELEIKKMAKILINFEVTATSLCVLFTSTTLFEGCVLLFFNHPLRL